LSETELLQNAMVQYPLVVLLIYILWKKLGDLQQAFVDLKMEIMKIVAAKSS